MRDDGQHVRSSSAWKHSLAWKLISTQQERKINAIGVIKKSFIDHETRQGWESSLTTHENLKGVKRKKLLCQSVASMAM